MHAKVTLTSWGCGNPGEAVMGVWEPLGFLSGSAGDWAWVWLGAVWMEALHPLGWVQEDSLEQLSRALALDLFPRVLQAVKYNRLTGNVV